MAIGSILPGRTPTALLTTRFSNALSATNERLVRLESKLATGQEFFTPGESPAQALRAIGLQSSLERNTQYQANTLKDQTFLNHTETSLSTISDAIIRAKGIITAGIGDATSSGEKQALALEVSSLIDGVLHEANRKLGGRYLFGGSQSASEPFEIQDTGVIRYNGDSFQIKSRLDSSIQIGNNIDGASAFSAFATVTGSDVDPALTLSTRLKDLNGGQGVDLGTIEITVDNGAPQTVQVNLTSAKTIEDVQSLIEDAFAGGPITLTVDIDPASNSGLRLTPSAGTVAVSDLSGSRTAAQLGIDSPAAASILGDDLDPNLTLLTDLSALNGGTGIGATAGNGLLVTIGETSTVVDISGATTVEDLLNELKLASPDLSVGINAAKDGLQISSRLSGTGFSIGENNGNNASLLGIRTLTAETPLADLNLNTGLPDETVDLEITLSDGTALSVDISGATDIQDVLDTLNAASPGNLTAALNSVGNGITLTDTTAGAGDFEIATNITSEALGIAGTQPGGGSIVGTDTNPQEANGILNILLSLEVALKDENNAELVRLGGLIEGESTRFNLVRSEVGSRLQLADEIDNRLKDQSVFLQEQLSQVFDADFAEVVTRLTSEQTTLQALLQVTASSFQLNLFNFL